MTINDGNVINIHVMIIKEDTFYNTSYRTYRQTFSQGTALLLVVMPMHVFHWTEAIRIFQIFIITLPKVCHKNKHYIPTNIFLCLYV